LYVGRAANLRRRVASYWGGLKDRRHLIAMVRKVSRVEVVACDSEHEAAWLERNILERSMPRWNRTAGGAESPIYLQLADCVATPGLRTTFRVADGSLWFGPYLGGAKTRLALSALHRLYPLPYTGTRLSGAEREMAAKLGVSAQQRTEMLATVSAVLARDASAVATALAALEKLRDAAAAELAFERAQRLHLELAALEWICAAQRATVRQGEDLVFYGWAEETLVRFEIVAGRLCDWQVRSCGSQEASEKLALTPACWADFAERNAAFAAALRNA
jgi:excinuclease ABC subunit C